MKVKVESLKSFAPVAQLDRVPGYELGGRTFESCRVRHIQMPASMKRAFFMDGFYSETGLVRFTKQQSKSIRLATYLRLANF